MIYAAIAAILWGGLTGVLHAPFWAIVIGGLGAAGLCLWLERTAIERTWTGDRRLLYWMIAPAYAFLAIVAVCLAAVVYSLTARFHL